MTAHHADSFDDEALTQRLFQELDHAIRQVNHDNIGRITGPVTRDGFIALADLLSRLRAAYLREVLALSQEDEAHPVDTRNIDRIRRYRLAYEEALSGFDALSHALKRGYLELAQ